MRKTEKKGVRSALHSSSAVRIMRSRPPAGQPPTTRAMLRLDRRTKKRVFIAAAVVIAFTVAVLAMGASKGIIVSHMPVVSPASKELTTRGFLELSISADGWNEESSTPVIVKITNTATGAVRCHAMRANGRETLEVDAGSYILECISPINADGGIYRVPEGGALDIAATHTSSRPLQLKPVAAADASREDYLAILDAARAAVALGDSTLAGDAGVQLLEKLQRNAEASPTYAPPPAEEPVWESTSGSSAEGQTPFYNYWPIPYENTVAPVNPEGTSDAETGTDGESPADGSGIGDGGAAPGDGDGDAEGSGGSGAEGSGDAGGSSDAGDAGGSGDAGDTGDAGGNGNSEDAGGFGDAGRSEGADAGGGDSAADGSGDSSGGDAANTADGGAADPAARAASR